MFTILLVAHVLEDLEFWLCGTTIKASIGRSQFLPTLMPSYLSTWAIMDDGQDNWVVCLPLFPPPSRLPPMYTFLSRKRTAGGLFWGGGASKMNKTCLQLLPPWALIKEMEFSESGKGVAMSRWWRRERESRVRSGVQGL